MLTNIFQKGLVQPPTSINGDVINVTLLEYRLLFLVPLKKTGSESPPWRTGGQFFCVLFLPYDMRFFSSPGMMKHFRILFF